jgi:hypothetical protein
VIRINSSPKASPRRSCHTAQVILPGLFLIAALTAGCASGRDPSSDALVASARSYWIDISLRTTQSLNAAYVYLDDQLKARCPEPLFDRSASNTNRFSDVQVSDPRVERDSGSIHVTVTYLVVGFMERDPDLPTSTYTSNWQWDGSQWRIVSPVGCVIND